MISSEEGLGIFRNWKTHDTVLWLVTLDVSRTHTVHKLRIREVSSNPPGIVVTREGVKDDVLAVDLTGAKFDEARPEGFRSEKFSAFLSVILLDERRLLFVELTE